MGNFEFKSQVATTKEQSERLLALGLKKDTADMWHIITTKDWKGNDIPKKKQKSWISFDGFVLNVGFDQFDRIPAWSLHRLVEMYTERYLACSVNLKIFTYEWLINEIEIQIKEGDFNKDYLEEKK